MCKLPNSGDYNDFDVRDCVIESWDVYPDFIKKNWVTMLLDDKRALQRQVIELERSYVFTRDISNNIR